MSYAVSMRAVGPRTHDSGQTLARIIARRRRSTTLRGMPMENSITNNLSKNSQALADKAADKAQGGIRDAQQAAKEAGSSLSIKVEELRSDTMKGIDRAQSIGQQGVDAITDAAQRARDFTADSAGSVIKYTKKHPMTALMIAAASGALLLSLIKVLRPSRD
jgi:ElaB/YqjD/DUF883 family membrane-anchored ribosome-binding protein